MFKNHITLRNKHIVQLVARTVADATAQGRVLTIDELVNVVMSAKPVMHYFDFDKASRILHFIDRHGLESIDRLRSGNCVKQKWIEVYQQVRETMDRHPGYTMAMALSSVMHFRRPSCYFVSKDTVRRLIRAKFRMGMCIIPGRLRTPAQ